MPVFVKREFAWDHELTRAVLGVYARVLQDFYVRRAHRLGVGRGRIGRHVPPLTGPAPSRSIR